MRRNMQQRERESIEVNPESMVQMMLMMAHQGDLPRQLLMELEAMDGAFDDSDEEEDEESSISDEEG